MSSTPPTLHLFYGKIATGEGFNTVLLEETASRV